MKTTLVQVWTAECAAALVGLPVPKWKIRFYFLFASVPNK